jgi:hypothetical protein
MVITAPAGFVGFAHGATLGAIMLCSPARR